MNASSSRGAPPRRYDRPWDFAAAAAHAGYIVQFHGADDPVVPLAGALVIAAGTHSEFTVLPPGTGHCTGPSLLQPLLDAVVARVGAAPVPPDPAVLAAHAGVMRLADPPPPPRVVEATEEEVLAALDARRSMLHWRCGRAHTPSRAPASAQKPARRRQRARHCWLKACVLAEHARPR